VLEELINHLGNDGRCDPSQERLAVCAKVSEDTVGRALEQAASLGLLVWQNRLKRAGWRAEQTSNAYELLIPGRPLASYPQPALEVVSSTNNLKSNSTLALRVAAFSEVEAAAARASIARIREGREVVLARAWAANRGTTR